MTDGIIFAFVLNILAQTVKKADFIISREFIPFRETMRQKDITTGRLNGSTPAVLRLTMQEYTVKNIIILKIYFMNTR